jgi:hypothetical protein
MSSLYSILMGLVGIAALMIPLPYYAEAQTTIPIPEFKPRAPEGQDNATGQQGLTEEREQEPRPTDFAMKVQLEPHDNEFLEGWYQVSDFALATSNSSELCPTGQCEFELEGGEMSAESTPGERSLNGKLNVETGDTTRILDLSVFWHAVEERQQDGETVQVIEGTLDASRDPTNPEYQSEINGTLTPDGNDFILELHGVAGSPYDLGVNDQTSQETDDDQTSQENDKPLEQLGKALEGLK